MEFHYVDLRCFCYETEQDDRVREALAWYLPEDAPIERQENEGHYGDTIAVLSSRVENMDEVREVFDSVREAPGFPTALTDLEDRVDEDCAFHLRLDKQAAYGGEAELGRGIQLTAKVEAYPAKKPKAVAAVRRSFDEAPED